MMGIIASVKSVGYRTNMAFSTSAKKKKKRLCDCDINIINNEAERCAVQR